MDNSLKWQDSCEVFDVVKRIWADGPHLPYALFYPTAVTNRNKSFSVVIGTKIEEHGKFKIIIFDHELVFKEITTFDTNSSYCCLTEVQME